MTTYDKWISTNPADDTDPEEEEIPEPTVEEVWIGWPVPTCHRVRFVSGNVYSVVQSTSGGFKGFYEIHGPGDYFNNGFSSDDTAIAWLCDPERRNW
jgi:hypothetical protein